MLALAAVEGKTPEELEDLRLQKREKRGGFEERVFLEWVVERDVE